MAGNRFRQRRLLVAVLAVGLFVLFNGSLVTPVAASAVMLPDCELACGPSADCNAGCKLWVGESLEEISCGEYNGGADNDQCNTCDYECTAWSAPGQECWIGGSTSDCESDGADYAECGDDICANGAAGEGCNTCAIDCDDCPAIVCGDEQCDPGETYVTCPDDCFDPGETGICGDGICSQDDEETPENCALDCIMPNERCEDNYDCGVGYTCVPGGEPMGGQCVETEHIWTLTSCETTPCPLGYVCRQIPFPGGGGGEYTEKRCIWWYDLQ